MDFLFNEQILLKKNIFIGMIIIDVKKSGGIDKALKQYKYKVFKSKIQDELREREEFKKKSVKKREAKLKASYNQKKKTEELNNF
jgi:small subunit ribosomal protein S21